MIGFVVTLINGCSTPTTIKKSDTNIYSMKEGKEQLDIILSKESAMQFDYDIPLSRHIIAACFLWYYPLFAHATEWDLTYKYNTLHTRVNEKSEIREEGEIFIQASHSFVPIGQVSEIRSRQEPLFRYILGRVNQARPSSGSVIIDVNNLKDDSAPKSDEEYVREIIDYPFFQNTFIMGAASEMIPVGGLETDYDVKIIRIFSDKHGRELGSVKENYVLKDDQVRQDKVSQNYLN